MSGIFLVMLSGSALAQNPPAASAPVTPPAAQETAVERQMKAVEAQRASIRKQMPAGDAKSASFFTVPWMNPPVVSMPAVLPLPVADCPAMAEKDLKPLVDKAAEAHKLQPELIRAVIAQESAGKPCAVSSKGAMGLMQIMPETAAELQLTDAFDAARNVEAGSRYLKQMLDRFKGDLKLALAAYNAGPSTVVPGGDVPKIPETEQYVQGILAKLGKPEAKKDDAAASLSR